MDEIVKKVNKAYVLKRLNNIRVYLKVSRLSDITNAAGTGIREDIFHGVPPTGPTASLLDWPKRRKPL